MRYFICCLFLLTQQFIYSQPEIGWLREYNAINWWDVSIDMCQDKGNNIIVGGTSVIQLSEISDYANVVIKYDNKGNEMWIRTLNEPKSVNDAPDNLVCDDSSNIFITGTLGWIKFIAKYNSNGDQLWIKPFYGHYKSYLSLDNFGNVYVAYTMVLNETGRLCIAKFDLTGNMSWFKQFDSLSTTFSEPKSLIYDGNKNFYLLGNNRKNYHYDDTYFIMCFDTSGCLNWIKQSNSVTSSPSYGLKLVKNVDDELIITARANSEKNVSLFKFSSNGDLVWSQQTEFNADYDNSPSDLTVDNSNNIILNGYCYQDSNVNTIREKFATAKYDNTGNLIFFNTYDEGLNNRGWGKIIATDNENGIYSVGSFSIDSLDQLDNMLILKYDKEGKFLWDIKKNIYGGETIPEKIIVNDVDDFFITTTSGGEVMASNIVTIRYLRNPQNISSESDFMNYYLDQNFPNPFNSSTSISYSIPKSSHVVITIFDILGNEVQKLVNEIKNQGNYCTYFDGSNLSSGIYFYKIISGNFNQTKKMILIK